MNSFLSGLYLYRQHPARSQLENFLTEALCHIAPRLKGVPEFSAGLALWYGDPGQSNEDAAIDKTFGNIIDCLRANQPDTILNWERKTEESKDGGRVTGLSASNPFSRLYQPDLDWRDQADQFYRNVLNRFGSIAERDLQAIRDSK